MKGAIQQLRGQEEGVIKKAPLINVQIYKPWFIIQDSENVMLRLHLKFKGRQNFAKEPLIMQIK